MYVKSEHKTMGRPKNLEITETKTWKIYSADVQTALNNDWNPKHVFRMGIKALNGNPEFINRLNSSELEHKSNTERLHRMSKMLDLQFRKTEQLEKKLIELGVKIDDLQ